MPGLKAGVVPLAADSGWRWRGFPWRCHDALSYKVERRLETAAHIKGGESEKLTRLAQRFQSPYAHRLVLVISGIPDPGFSKRRRLHWAS